MATTPQLPPKKDVMLALLERSSVFIHLDPRPEEVRVPPWFKKQPQLVLQVGLNMAVRIPDLSVEDDAISCTLSFSRSPFFCYLPLRHVFALVGEDGKGMVWPDDVPKEVAAQQAERAAQEQARSRLRSAASPEPSLEARTEAPAAGEPSAASPRKLDPAGKAARSKGGKAARAGKANAPGGGSSRTPRAAESKAGGPGPVSDAAAPKEAPRGAELGRSGRNQPSAGPARESKRPLPPYLRVVK